MFPSNSQTQDFRKYVFWRSSDEQNNWEKLYGSKLTLGQETAIHTSQNETVVTFLEVFKTGKLLQDQYKVSTACQKVIVVKN